MQEFGKYLKKFRTISDTQTHLSLTSGKYIVPKDQFKEFYKKYYQAVKVKQEALFLVEKVQDSFSFFMDLERGQSTKGRPGPSSMDRPADPVSGDPELDDAKVLELVSKVTDCFTEESEKKYLVSKRLSRYHIHFYNKLVDTASALEVIREAGLEDNVYVDKSVYKTGLRMIGSAKVKGETSDKDLYRLYNLDTGVFDTDMSFADFCKTSILYSAPSNKPRPKSPSVSTSSSPGSDTSNIPEAVQDLFTDLKDDNPADLSPTCYLTSVKMDIKNFVVFLGISDRHCPFIEREHTRQSGPLYLLVNTNGVFIKCHDTDCSKRNVRLECNSFMSIFPVDSLFGPGILDLLRTSLSETHYDIAYAIFTMFKDKYRVDSVKNPDWHSYDGVRWKKSNSINSVLSTVVAQVYRQFSQCTTDKDEKAVCWKIIKCLGNMNFKDVLLKQLAYLYHEYDPDFYSKLDSNEHLVGFEDGVYDLEKGEFRDGKPSDYISFSTGYKYQVYNPEKAQEIKDFMVKILPKPEIYEYIMKVLARSLCGVVDEKFYIFTGISGANGKSTLINFLEYTMGDYAAGVDTGLLTAKRGNPSNASPDMIRLKGARYFFFSETESDDKLKTGVLKQMSGGDTLTARALYKECVSFKSQGSMFMCCNYPPIIESNDGGTWRRVSLVEFNSRFVAKPTRPNEYEAEPNLKPRLRAWKADFMALLLEYYKTVKDKGIEEPASVKLCTDTYRDENDSFSTFFNLRYLEEPGAFTTVSEVYHNFGIWWIENFPSTKCPDIKQLRKAMRTRYGRERVQDKVKGYGIQEVGSY